MAVMVSICLLSWNHEKYIEQCIQSIIDQSFQDFELIYLDNASTDATYEKAVALLEELNMPKSIFRNETPKKISENENFLYSKVNGKYIANLSGDDWWAADNLKLKVAYYDSHPNLGLLYGSGWIYYDDTDMYEQVNTTKFKRGSVFDDLIYGNFVFGIGFMVKREVMMEIGPWDEAQQIEDWDMWLRIAKRYEIDYITTPTVYYRRHRSNTSLPKSSTYVFDQLKVLDQYKEHKNYMAGRQRLVKELIYHEVKFRPSFKTLLLVIRNFRLEIFYFKQTVKALFLSIMQKRKRVEH